MNEKLEELLKQHIREELLDFAEIDVDPSDLDGILENVKKDVNRRVGEYIDTVKEI